MSPHTRVRMDIVCTSRKLFRAGFDSVSDSHSCMAIIHGADCAWICMSSVSVDRQATDETNLTFVLYTLYGIRASGICNICIRNKWRLAFESHTFRRVRYVVSALFVSVDLCQRNKHELNEFEFIFCVFILGSVDSMRALDDSRADKLKQQSTMQFILL